MPPPTNITSGTAVVISSIDYDVTQSGLHDAGTTYTVWYRYDTPALASEDVIGIQVRGDGVVYIPTCNVWIDNDATLLGTINGNLMTQIPFLPGRTYFLQIVPNVGNPNPASVRIRLWKQPRLGFSSGDIFIRAASILAAFQSAGYGGLAGGVINPVTGVIKDFDPTFQCGDSGDYLSTGELCFADEYNNPPGTIRIYNPTLPLTLKTSVAYQWRGLHPQIRTWREGLKFLVVDDGSAAAPATPLRFFTIDRNGVQSAVTDITGFLGCTGAAMSPAGDFVYIAGVGSLLNSNIKKWNVAGAAFDADFAADQGANYVCQDILVMKNGEVVAIYQDTGTDSIFVNVYDSSGATLQTYTAPAVPYTSIAARLGYANNDSTSFWVFLHQSDGFSRFIELQLSDVSILTNITTPDSTYMALDKGANPTYHHVTSDSCPFVLLLAASPAGVLVVVPNKRTDSDGTNNVAIPNPTFRTALMP